MDKEEFNHNLQRKVDAQDLPKAMTVRRKSEIQALKFEKLRKENRKRTENDGNQKTFEFILDLAFQKYMELEQKEEEIIKASA